MGFFDVLGEYVGKKFNEAADDYQNASEQAERLDDQRLVNKFKDEKNYVRKMTYGMELKKRQEEMNSRREEEEKNKVEYKDIKFK